MTPQLVDITSSSIFGGCRISLVNFSYWFKFYINIKNGSGVMRVFAYKELTRNPNIGNTPVGILPNIWRLGQVRDTKFGTNVFNKKLLNAAKFQGYSFCRFWVIKRKQTGSKIAPPPLPPNTQTHTHTHTHTHRLGFSKLLQSCLGYLERLPLPLYKLSKQILIGKYLQIKSQRLD